MVYHKAKYLCDYYMTRTKEISAESILENCMAFRYTKNNLYWLKPEYWLPGPPLTLRMKRPKAKSVFSSRGLSTLMWKWVMAQFPQVRVFWAWQPADHQGGFIPKSCLFRTIPLFCVWMKLKFLFYLDQEVFDIVNWKSLFWSLNSVTFFSDKQSNWKVVYSGTLHSTIGRNLYVIHYNLFLLNLLNH